MMNYIATALLASSMLFPLAATLALEKPVTFKGAIQRAAEQTDRFTITVELDIKDGWHTYDEVGEGPGGRTALKLKLPKGVEAKGDWNRPSGIEGTEIDSLIYEGQVSFSRSVVIDPNAYGKSIDVIVSYQACTDEYCNRPTSKTVSIAIPEESLSSSTAALTSSNIFDGPVRLSVDGKPLNTVPKKRFLSPAMFDVDGDGQAELVIGTLMGRVGVYENQNTSGTGDPVWGSWEDLKDAEGKAIRTSNW